MSTSTRNRPAHSPYFALFHSPLAGTGQACGGHRVSAGQRRAGRGQARGGQGTGAGTVGEQEKSGQEASAPRAGYTVFTFTGLEKAGKCLFALEWSDFFSASVENELNYELLIRLSVTPMESGVSHCALGKTDTRHGAALFRQTLC